MEKNLKIAFVCTLRSLGGLELNFFNLNKWMLAKGHDCTFFVTEGSPLHQRAQENKIPFILIKNAKKHFPLKASQQLKKECLKRGINHLFASSTQDMELVVLAKILGGKRGFLAHFLQQMEIGVNKRDFIHTFKYKQLDSWITPLPWLKKQLQERTKIQSHKVHLIPLCIELERFTNIKQTKEELRQKLALPIANPLVGFIGRCDYIKGIHTVCEAYNLYSKKNPDTHLVIVTTIPEKGTPHYPYWEKIQVLIGKAPYPEKIHIISFMEKVEEAYKTFDVFVMPSLAETFGMVTVESMVSQTPVIGANAGGTAEILNHGELGLIFEPDDPKDLCQKLEIAMNGESFKREELVQKAYQNAVKNYSSETMVSRIEKLFSTFES